MANRIIFWSIKSRLNEGKFQYEEGIGPHKLSTLAKRQGYETIIFNDHQFGSNPDQIKRVTESNVNGGKTIVAYSLLSAGIPLLERIAQMRTAQGVPVLIGGMGASLEPERVLRMFNDRTLDLALIQGEAEGIFDKLISAPPSSWRNIEGVWAYDSSGSIRRGCFHAVKDLDESPFADLGASSQRSEAERKSDDTSLPPEQRLEMLKSLTVSQIESRRGCYLKCGFCNTSALPQGVRLVRKSSPRRLVEEMRNMFENYGITFFSLTDNIAFDIPDWWENFADLMQEQPFMPFIQFGGYSCPRILNRDAWMKKTLPRLYSVGLRGVILGAQAGSKRVLEEVVNRPGDDPENALEITRAAVPLGINVKVDFIVGHPTETLEDLRTTRRWINEIYQNGGEVFVRELGVVPHSKYSDKLKARMYALPERTSEFQAEVAAILKMKAVDNVYRRIAFSEGRVPNKYLIDRGAGILYPSTHFGLQTLQANADLLNRSGMPEHIRDRYRKMFALAMKLKKGGGYDF
jgi:radical SAM superfamily enzyme YgiQ (UPF0313 family)